MRKLKKRRLKELRKKEELKKKREREDREDYKDEVMGAGKGLLKKRFKETNESPIINPG